MQLCVTINHIISQTMNYYIQPSFLLYRRMPHEELYPVKPL